MGKEDSEFMQVDETSSAVQMHLEMIQGVIQRMATNSASCKTWCITIVAAILVVVAEKDRPTLGFLSILPTLLFGVLDVYYLALEKGFIASYHSFVRKLHAKKLEASDLYTLEPTGNMNKLQLNAVKSFSVWGFYLALVILAILTIGLTAK